LKRSILISIILIISIMACNPIGNEDINTFIQVSAGVEQIGKEDTYSLPYTTIDQTISEYITITNISDEPLSITEVSLSGNDEGYFSIDTTSIEDTVEPDDMNQFKVSFTPNQDIVDTASINISINKTKDTFSFILRGSTPRNVWLEMIQNQPQGYDESFCPKWRHSASMVSAGDDRIILFGGSGEGAVYHNDVWEYTISTNEWDMLMAQDDPGATSQPDGRFAQGMVYIGNDKIIMFGGSISLDEQNDTWEYDIASNEWTNLNPASHPDPRKSFCMTYDHDSNMIYLFGGYDGNKFDDLWVYDVAGNSWSEITTTPKPPARMSGGMVYAGNSKLILFGGKGQDLGVYYNDMWEYDITGDAWTEISISGSQPPEMWGHQIEYLPGENGIILFGGHDSDSYFDDTWKFNLTDNSWQEINPDSSIPDERWNHSMAYDESMDSVILFGGNNTGGKYNDTWKYKNAPLESE
jgi:N-acetylneuraminic acid mutarotase